MDFLPTNSDLTDAIADYDFDLPPELIAQRPADRRDGARLLVVRKNPTGGLPQFEDLLVTDLPALVSATPELQQLAWVRNRSRVFPARFYVRRPTGGRHEIVLLEPTGAQTTQWRALIRGQGDFKYPQKLFTDNETRLQIESPAAGIVDLAGLGPNLLAYLSAHGEMPLPPYIKDRHRETDLGRYQPVWADADRWGSAAAPTASLHFSDELIQTMGARWLDTFLHVGLGTFEPYRHERLSEGTLHSERIEIPAATLDELKRLKALHAGHPFCLSIGTTALRNLESLNANDPWRPGPEHEHFEATPAGITARTRAFIRPGFEFHYTRALWTNFHLPQSTLFVLVATFCGSRRLAVEAYRHAIARKYRFFSYGDATLWL